MTTSTYADAHTRAERAINTAFDTLVAAGLTATTATATLTETIAHRALRANVRTDDPAHNLTEDQARHVIGLTHLALAVYGGRRERLSSHTTAATRSGRAAVNRAAALRPAREKNTQITPMRTNIDPVLSPEHSRYYVTALLHIPTATRSPIRAASIVIGHTHPTRSRRATTWRIEAFDIL